MAARTATPESWLSELPPERQAPVARLREVLRAHLPEGFEETLDGHMLAYVVPKRLYPDGYHCDPEKPLPFIQVASQKNFVALYHLGLYTDPELLAWFRAGYAQAVPTKLDMGKSCIRFRRPERMPFELIGELAAKMTPEAWIARYEGGVKR